MLNIKQLSALQFAKQNNNIFLSGPAGTGKSYTIKEIINYLKSVDKKYAITALTGCAAFLVKGQTIHSFLGMGIGNDTVDKIIIKLKANFGKYKKIRALETLIIDEISIMDISLFEKINTLLSLVKDVKEPFGGIQVILVGDFYQLPPINGDYCFESKIWTSLNLKTVYLTEIIRQKDDMGFQIVLNDIRQGILTNDTKELLTKLQDTVFPKKIKPVKLFALNKDVDYINTKEFTKQYKINNNITEKKHDFSNVKIINCYPSMTKENTPDYPEYTENDIFRYKPSTNNKQINLDDYEVNLIKNLQIMIIRNINVENGLVNGTTGTIIKITPEYIVIHDNNNNYHTITYYSDINENNNTYIKFLPIKPAYAISIHKAQGATLNYIEIDASNNIFTVGQLYTALSRGKTMDNIKLNNLDFTSFMTNNKVKEYYSKLL